VTISEIFNQINVSEIDQVRKRAINFLVTKLPLFIDNNSATTTAASTEFHLNKDIEDLLVQNVKKSLMDVDSEEFILFIRLLTALPSMSTLTGRQELVNIIMSQSEIDKSFNDDTNPLERLIILFSCIQQAIPLFSRNVPSTKYVNYYLENVLVVFNSVKNDDIQFEIIKSLADLCSHFNGNSNVITANQSNLNLKTLFTILLKYLPDPPTVTTDAQTDTKFNFSYVECLLYSFHLLARFQPDFFTSTPEAKEQLGDFRIKLQYFAKGTQNYIKELRHSLANVTTQADKESEENKIRRVALKVTTNIDTLIKDLFHNPPSFKSSITLSWKQEQVLTSSLFN
jgi:hypothetical protein